MPSLAKIQKYRSRTARSMCRKKTEKKCARVKGCKMTRKTMKRKSYCRKSRRHLVGGAKVVGGGDNYDPNEIGKYVYNDTKPLLGITITKSTLYYKYNNKEIPLLLLSRQSLNDGSRQIIYEPNTQDHLKDITQIVIHMNPLVNNTYSVKRIGVQTTKLPITYTNFDSRVFFLR
jgi:hypothetical protein